MGTDVFQTRLDKFISMYVLCANCRLPEIDMVVNKRGFVVATCKACGWNGDMGNMHKVATYIQRNPPDTGVGFDGEGKKPKLSRSERQAARSKKKHDGEEEEDEETEKKEKKKKKDKDGSDEDGEEDDDDDDEGAEKKKKKKKNHHHRHDEDGKEKKHKHHKDKKDKKEKKE